MDRNTIIGTVLIVLTMGTWLYFQKPTPEQIAQRNAQRAKDSLEYIQKHPELTTAKKDSTSSSKVDTASAHFVAPIDTVAPTTKDSVLKANKEKQYGVFAPAIYENGKSINNEIVIENDLMKVYISSLGGKINSVELKKYLRADKITPVRLFTAGNVKQGITFATGGNTFSTDSLLFDIKGKSFVVTGNDSNSVSLRLKTSDPNKYIECTYSLKGNSHLVGYKFKKIGLDDLINGDVALEWSMTTPSQEQVIDKERQGSSIYYKNDQSDVESIRVGLEEKTTFTGNLKWLAFRQQFFTSVLIADKTFYQQSSAQVLPAKQNDVSVCDYTSELRIDNEIMVNGEFGMQFYFGPTHYYTLKGYNLDLEQQIPLGWWVFSYINKWVVLPVFDFLGGFNISYGIIILLLTLFIKGILFPVAYKTYLSSAKMRVLKPEIDEISKKHKEDPMKKQQATMALYKKAGVNPLAGCLPVIPQLFILSALFSFFPASFELRQQSFLWAHDLSTYDSIWDFGNIPIINSIYGNHVSLFTLLMTVSTLLYTYSNSQLMGNTEQMPGMKFMMYAMPVVFLGVFNSYSAGLSYYYFLANMITFGQTWLMRKFIDEKALHAKIEENKKKPVKTSGFQKRLEEMAKQRQQQMKKK